MPTLTLYHLTNCPYCHKVIHYLTDNKIEMPRLKNLDENSSYRDELISIGGKGQVPCLIIDGNALYESNDIIQWFKENNSK